MNLVAVDEGNNIGFHSPSTLNECDAGCNKKPDCNSFAFCLGWGCHFKDKLLDGHEGTKHHAHCTTFFKRKGKYVFYAHLVL
jgi:hypothetical protein